MTWYIIDKNRSEGGLNTQVDNEQRRVTYKLNFDNNKGLFSMIPSLKQEAVHIHEFRIVKTVLFEHQMKKNMCGIWKEKKVDRNIKAINMISLG